MTNDPHTSSPLTHPLRWFPEFLEFGKRRFRTQGRVLGAAILVGIVAGLGGVAFTFAGQFVVRYALEGVAGYKADGPAGEAHSTWIPDVEAPTFQPWLLLVVPTVGGLLSGFLVFRFAPEAEGHGTDAAIAAYHTGQGIIRPRVPLIKIVASALTIGTGGSGGREGPIAQIGAGFGSLLAALLGYRVAERRILLAAGMGAGIAAIFRAPLAGTLFAAEVLYCSPEFEPEVIMPAGLASVVSYCTFGVVMNVLGDPGERFRSLFHTPDLTLHQRLGAGPVPAAGPVGRPAVDGLRPHLLRPDPPVPPLADAAHLQAGRRRLPDRRGRPGPLLRGRPLEVGAVGAVVRLRHPPGRTRHRYEADAGRRRGCCWRWRWARW